MEKQQDHIETKITNIISKAEIIEIGEFHETRSNFQMKQKSDISIIHDIIEKYIFDYLIGKSKELARPISILFVDECQDENERNNNLINRFSTLNKISPITSKMSRITEFSKSIMSNPSNRYLYYMSSLISFLRLLDGYRQNPSLTRDVQYDMEINENYFRYIFYGSKLNEIITIENYHKITDVVKIILQKNPQKDYQTPFANLLDMIIGLLHSTGIVDTDLGARFLPMFETIKNIPITKRLGESQDSGLYCEIMEMLRNIRDEKLFSRMDITLTTKPFDFIVCYFGMNHYDNHVRLVSKSKNMKLSSISMKMDIETMSEFMRPGSNFYSTTMSVLT